MAHTFASLCLGYEPKAKVVTLLVHMTSFKGQFLIVTNKGGGGGIRLENGRGGGIGVGGGRRGAYGRGGGEGGGENVRGIGNENVGMVQITLPLGTCEVGTIGVCFLPLGF